MADERHAPDTWFLVAEEDWRLRAEHCNVNPLTLAAAGEATYRAWHPRRSEGFQETVEEDSGIHVDALYRERLKATPLAGEGMNLFDASVRSPEWTRLVGAFYTRTQKPSKDDIETYGVNEVVLDLVMMATAADREGKGDLLWYCWDGGKAKGQRWKVNHASTLIGVSAKGARQLHEAMQGGQIRKRHGDLALLDWIHKNPNFGASYMWPAVGHYQSHLSQSSEHQGFRPGSWESSWVQGGSRLDPTIPGHQHRWLCGFQKEKGIHWIRMVQLPPRAGEDLRWFTLRLRSALCSAEAEPVAASGEEEETDEEASEGKGGGKKGKKNRPVIAPLHPDLVRTLQYAPESARVTKRQRREQRSRLANYARRHFTDDPDQARGVGSGSQKQSTYNKSYLLFAT